VVAEPVDEGEAGTDFEAAVELPVDFVAEPVDEGDSSLLGATEVCEAEAVGPAAVGGVEIDDALGDGDALGLVVVVVGVLGFVVVVGVLGVVVGLVVGFVVVGLVVGRWSLGRSGSGVPRFGPRTMPSIEP
jgi:hypothetical protein